MWFERALAGGLFSMLACAMLVGQQAKSIAGESRPMTSLKKDAEFAIGGNPDWSAVAKDAVWVTTGRGNQVVQMLAASNTVGARVDVARPCSGLAEGFGSIWAPSCKDKVVVRIDEATGKVIGRVAAGPANSEGGIATGAGSVWMVDDTGALLRIDPATSTVVRRLSIPGHADNPLFADGYVWITCGLGLNSLLQFDPTTETIAKSIEVGPLPRFLTAGAGSIWTLNQGDGTVSRVDVASGRVVAIVPAGLPGEGGEISFGDGFVWVTMFGKPLTQIDPSTNTVVNQWHGAGGDGLRFGFGSVWLSNGKMGSVWRVPPVQP